MHRRLNAAANAGIAELVGSIVIASTAAISGWASRGERASAKLLPDGATASPLSSDTSAPNTRAFSRLPSTVRSAFSASVGAADSTFVIAGSERGHFAATALGLRYNISLSADGKTALIGLGDSSQVAAYVFTR